MQDRPKKECYASEEIALLRIKAIEKVVSMLLPNEKIIKIYLIGSSIKNDFGKYEPPGFRDSLYSDFDFIVFVDDDYKIPDWLNREPSGKPFSCDEMNLAYRNKNFIDDRYDVEIFFIRRKNMYDEKIKEEGELAGIPMTPESKNKCMLIYSKKMPYVNESFMGITIDFLKNYPHHIPRLIQIAREGLGPTWSPDEEQLRQYLHIDLLPLTLVAIDNSTPVGMCSLTKAKGLRHDLTPWLGPLVVDKQYQMRGIGSQLIEAIKQKARILGFEKLYLCTHDPELATRYYQRRGWNIIGADEWKGHSVTVMKINLHN